jgi:hypothetical protein
LRPQISLDIQRNQLFQPQHLWDTVSPHELEKIERKTNEGIQVLATSLGLRSLEPPQDLSIVLDLREVSSACAA